MRCADRALTRALGRFLACALIWAASCAGAWAASATYDILLDTDDKPATGCTVALPAPHGSFVGAELVLRTTVATHAGGATVTGVSLRACSAGVLGAAVPVASGSWPVGLGTGTSASAIVETFLPLAQLGSATRVRAAVMSTTDGGGDALVGAAFSFGPVAPPGPGGTTAIPVLSPLSLALLVAAMGLIGGGLARRHGAPLGVLCVCFLMGASGVAWAAAIVLDGQGDDWAGLSPVITGTKGDAPPNADLVALWATQGGSNAYFRIDADVVADNGVAPPNPTLGFGPLPDRSIPVGQPWALRLAANASDPAASLAYQITEGPTDATLVSGPQLRWTPGAGDVGQHHRFTVAASDGTRNAQASFNVTVTAPANRPPEIAPQSDAQIGASRTFSRAIVATDPDGDTVTLALLSGPPGASLSGTTLSWSTSAADLGEHFFSLRASDPHGANGGARFAVRVAPQAAPVALDDAYEVRQGQTLTVSAAGVLTNDSAPDGGALTAEKRTDPDKGTLTAFHADGSFTYQAPASLPSAPPFKMALRLHADDGRQADDLSIGDVNGDGVADFVSIWVSSSIGRIRAMSGVDGSVLWSHTQFPAPYSSCHSYSNAGGNPVVADVDDDGKMDVVLSVFCQEDTPGVSGVKQRVMALDGHDGTVKWQSPKLSGIDINGVTAVSYSALAVARLSPDGPPMILGGSTAGSGPGIGHLGDCDRMYGVNFGNRLCRSVFALNGKTGALERRFYDSPRDDATLEIGPSTGYFDTSAVFFWPPLVADLDGDGAPELLFGGTVWAEDGRVLHQYDGTAAHVGVTAFAAADLDGDGKAELLLVETAKAQGGQRLRAVHLDGTPLWDIPAPYCVRMNSCGLTVADLDGDGTPEVLLMGLGHLMMYDALGRLRWSHVDLSWRTTTDIYSMGIAPQPAVYDLDGDGVAEVIVRVNNKLVALRGDTGVLLDEFELTPNTVIPDLLDHRPLVQVVDVDGDGHAEIVASVVGYYSGPDAGVKVLKSANDPWMPVRRRWGSINDHHGNVDALTGKVAAVPPTPGVNGAPNVYGAQKQLATRPDLRNRARTAFQYHAQAGGLASEPATVTIGIAPPNSPPRITSTPPGAARSGVDFSYPITAVDPDPGDTITYSLVFSDEEGGIAVNASTGVFTRTGRGGDGPALSIVRATDSQGAYTDQAFVINFVANSPGSTATVPMVEGMARGAALATIADSPFSLGTLNEVFDDTVAAGKVVSQTPAAAGSQLAGTTIHLTLSKGATPRPAPNLVGALASTAGGLLPAPFALGNVSHVYSDSVERGRILVQTPAAGTQVTPGAVDVVVSGGTGLALALNRAYTSADAPIAFSASAFAPDGASQALPTLSYTVTPVMTPFAGPLPSASGGQVVFGLATRGAFRLTASGGGRSTSADFAVGPPAVGSAQAPMVEFVQLSQTLQGVSDLLHQAQGLDADAAKAKVAAAVTLWRTLDRDALRLTAPMTIEGGFLPTLADLTAKSVAPGPQDALNKQLLRQSIAPLKDLTAGLRARHTPLTVLNAQMAAFDAKARLVGGLMPSEYGAVMAAPEYALIVSHAIPDMVDALMDDLGEGVGLGRAARPFPGLKSALVDTLAAMAIEQAIATATPLIDGAKKYAKDILGQAAWGAAAVALAGHAKEFLAGQDLGAIASGASMSIRVFESPWAFVEARGLEWEYTDLNTVVLLGPDLLGAVQGVVDKIKEAWKFDPADDSGNYKSASDIKDDLKKLKKGLQDATNVAVETIEKAFQSTDEEAEDCLFDSHPMCTMLLFSDGFDSVYHYDGPSGGSGLGGLPVPIVFIVRNNVSGQLYFGTAPFLPTPTP